MKVITKITLSVALICIGVGIGLLFIAGGRRSSFKYTSAYSVENTVEDVKRMEISIDYGELTITQGDEFSISANNLYNTDDLNSYVSDGTWVINHDTSYGFRLFGFSIPVSIGGIEDFNSPRIYITVPKDFHAEEIKVILNAGVLRTDNLSADRGRFKVNAGFLEIDGLEINEEINVSVDAGYIKLKKVDIKNLIADCNIGSINIAGLVTGDNRVYCDLGKIKLDIDDNMDNYSFDIDSDFGNVIINDRSYYKRNINRYSSNDKGNFLLRVNLGNVSLDFRDR